jgi:hypothetical protein
MMTLHKNIHINASNMFSQAAKININELKFSSLERDQEPNYKQKPPFNIVPISKNCSTPSTPSPPQTDFQGRDLDYSNFEEGSRYVEPNFTSKLSNTLHSENLFPSECQRRSSIPKEGKGTSMERSSLQDHQKTETKENFKDRSPDVVLRSFDMTIHESLDKTLHNPSFRPEVRS